MNKSEEALFLQLRDVLLDAVRTSIARARREHGSEQLYAYILYTCPLLEYVVPSFNTEEALRRIAKNDQECERLRWSPQDWEYYLEGEELFARANDVLRALDQVQDVTEEAARERRWQVFLDALHALDSKGIFGTGKARESLLVNIMCGDQDIVAQIESARQLNPKTSYLEYAKHELPSLYSWEKEIKGSRSMYRDKSLERVRRAITQVEQDLGKSC